MLEMDLFVRKGILFVRLTGTLSKATSEQWKKEIQSLVEDQGVKYFVFNLSGVTAMDKEGLQSLKENYQQILSTDGKLVLCGVKDTLSLSIDKTPGLSDIERSQNEYAVEQMLKL